MKLTTKQAVMESMERYNKHCEDNPTWLGMSDDAKETAAYVNETERLANELRLERYAESGVISSAGAW